MLSVRFFRTQVLFGFIKQGEKGEYDYHAGKSEFIWQKRVDSEEESAESARKGSSGEEEKVCMGLNCFVFFFLSDLLQLVMYERLNISRHQGISESCYDC